MSTTPINLTPAYRRLATQRARRLRRWTGGGLAYAAVAGIVWVGCAAGWTQGQGLRDRGRIERRIHQLKQAVVRISPRLDTARLKLRANRAVTRQPDWSILLAAVSGVLGERAVLEQCRLGPITTPSQKKQDAQHHDPRYRLRLDGMARSQAATLAFVSRLQGLGIFERVTLIRTSRRPFRNAHAVAFEIACVLGREEEKPS